MRKINIGKIFVTFCAAFLFLASTFPSWADQPAPKPAWPFPDIAVPDTLKTCGADSDCVMIRKACVYCCDVDAINVNGKADYEELAKKTCGAGSAPCGCAMPENGYPAICQHHICELVKTKSSFPSANPVVKENQ